MQLILIKIIGGIHSTFKNIRKLKNVRSSKEACILIGLYIGSLVRTCEYVVEAYASRATHNAAQLLSSIIRCTFWNKKKIQI